MADRAPPRLKREVGSFGAAMMGLGSIIGTGVFVSIGVAAGIAGPSVLLAVAVGAAVASLNGLSSAQLAANHPVSGGTYEYGYRYLNPLLGFLAGWTFLLAKSASAATAALGLAAYALALMGVAPGRLHLPAASAAVVLITLLVLTGIRHSTRTNIVAVLITLASLAVFVVAGFPTAVARAGNNLLPLLVPEEGRSPPSALLHASALMFVAYTGYGRIATLGEEVRDPRRNIPRAILAALVSVMIVYALVAFVAVSSAGSAYLAAPQNRAAPLEAAARTFPWPGASGILSIGAVAAMFGVLLNLLLGLSRVLLAMGRRRDMPVVFARLDRGGTTPGPAVVAVGALILAMTMLGDVRLTWSFSAFAVLVYYAITNLAALRLGDEERFYPRWLALAGLLGCLALAFVVDPAIWLIGLGLLALGAAWHLLARRQARRADGRRDG